MILFLEGPRGSGKTYLIDKFFEQNENPNIIRYKFYFVNWVNRLGLKNNDTDRALHYMSLGNILSVMEHMANDNSKLVVFDRGLYGCYVWSQLRKRISYNTAVAELIQILLSPEYKNCKTLYIEPVDLNDPNRSDLRNKDMWDNVHPGAEEARMYKELFLDTIVEHTNMDNNTWVKEYVNSLTDYDVSNIIGFINDLASELDD